MILRAGGFIERAAAGRPIAPQTYTTLFPATENPINESGNWTRTTPTGANAWHDVRTTGGNAVPSANAGSSAPDFDDSYALLVGSYPADMAAEATIYVGSGASGALECELLFRGTQTSTTIACYECLFAIGGGVAIVRWNGPADGFDELKTDATGLTDTGGLSDGDRVKAQITGQTISMWYSRAATPTTWVSIGSYTDNSASKLTTGNPGIGFFARSPLSIDFGFKDYTATSL